MGGVKPIATFYEAQLMRPRPIEKQSPAFTAYLNAVGEAERHGLIDSANAVDV
jgi:hypothetical protein